MKIYLKRGWNRTFVIICVVWVVFLVVGMPMIESRSRYKYAREMFDLAQKAGPADWESVDQRKEDQKAILKTYEENIRRGHYSEIYRDFLSDKKGLIIVTLIPPAILYLVVLTIYSITRWVYRGYTGN
ncbi:MAG TPA: hypothetical protein VHE61_08995 [Opitutaceae bacterium]|nr:hypothetical protein [Opitutaceae bacterium]